MERKKVKPIFALLVAVIAFVGIQYALYHINLVSKGIEIMGTDTFMRLTRVEALNESHDWYNTVMERNNAPYGDELHWTRPLDVLLYLPAKVLSLVMDYKVALYQVGIFFSLGVGIVCMMLFYWVSKELIEDDFKPFLYLLFISQILNLEVFKFGRPDHHSLILLCLLILIGFLVRLKKEAPRKYSVLIGVLLGVGIWISVEVIFEVVLVFMVLGIAWVFEDHNEMKQSFEIGCALTGSTALFLLVERPLSQFGKVEFDKISIAYLILFGVICMIFYLSDYLYILTKKKIESRFHKYLRFLMVSILAGVGAAVVFLIFPKFIHGPFTDVNPEIIPIWLSRVQEVQPLLGSDRSAIGNMILSLGMPLISVIYLMIDLKSRRKLEFRVSLFFILGIVLYSCLSLYQIRWLGYVQIITLIPSVLLLKEVLEKVGRVKYKRWVPIFRISTIFVFMFIFSIVGFSLMIDEDEVEEDPKCSIKELSQWAIEHPEILGEEKTILAFLDFGPELLYRTKLKIISSPYHRNDQGILFNYNVMISKDENYSIKELKKRKVNWILVTSKKAEQVFYEYVEGNGSLYDRLLNDDLPSWIIEQQLPEELSDFRLFRVKVEEK